MHACRDGFNQVLYITITFSHQSPCIYEPNEILVFYYSEDEQLHTDVDNVDAVVEQLMVQGNTFGQSAALSQGMSTDIATVNID